MAAKTSSSGEPSPIEPGTPTNSTEVAAIPMAAEEVEVLHSSIRIGSLAQIVVAVIAFHNVDKPGEVIAAVLGPVTAVVGTLAGYVAGQTAGAAGKEKAEERANVAQDRLTAVLDESPPNILDQVRQKRPDLFS